MRLKDLRPLIIQLFLTVVAYYSYLECSSFGEQKILYSATIKNNSQEIYNIPNPISGFNGGAIGMGLICGASLLGISIIEIKK